MAENNKRPVQIQLEREVFDNLRLYAAYCGTTANELIADLARRESERVGDYKQLLGSE